MSDSGGDEDGGSGGHYYQTDSETGRIEEQYSDRDFIDAVEAREAASTGQIASAVGCTRRRALDRLKDLADGGQIRNLQTDAGFSWLPVEDESDET